MMQFKNKWIPPFVFTCCTWTPTIWNSRIAFSSISSAVIAIQLLLFFLLLTLWILLEKLYSKILCGDSLIANSVKFYAFYVAFMLLFLILLYPGAWSGDDINIYNLSAAGQIQYWHNYLTSVYYIMAMLLFPFPAGIVLFKILLSAGIAAYFYYELHFVFSKHYQINMMLIPFFLPPVIDFNLYPIRMSLYALLEFLLCVVLFMAKYKKVEMRLSHLSFISVLTAFLAGWRTEGIYYSILVPAVIVMLFPKIKNKHRIILAVMSVSLSILVMLPQYYGEKTTYEYRYQLSGVMSPIQPLIHAMYQNNDNELLNYFSSVMDTEKIEEYYMKNETVPERYTMDYNKSISPLEMRDFKIGYIKSIIKYFDVFVENRNKIFRESMRSGWRNNTAYLYINPTGEKEYFTTHYILNKPLNLELRNTAAEFLEGYGVWSENVMFYCMFPQLGITVCLTLYLLIKRSKYVLILLLAECRMILVYLTAPAPYFMYYYTLWILGTVFIIAAVLKVLSSLKRY